MPSTVKSSKISFVLFQFGLAIVRTKNTKFAEVRNQNIIGFIHKQIRCNQLTVHQPLRVQVLNTTDSLCDAVFNERLSEGPIVLDQKSERICIALLKNKITPVAEYLEVQKFYKVFVIKLD